MTRWFLVSASASCYSPQHYYEACSSTVLKGVLISVKKADSVWVITSSMWMCMSKLFIERGTILAGHWSEMVMQEVFSRINMAFQFPDTSLNSACGKTRLCSTGSAEQPWF